MVNTTTNVRANEATLHSVAQDAATDTATKAPRKPREKVRPISTLIDPNISVKSLSDKEKVLLIEYYKGETNKLAQQVEAYRRNAEEAFKKAQMFEQFHNNTVQQTNLKFNDIMQAVSVMYKTISLIVKDGMNND